MATSVPKLDFYKLETVFGEDYVAHTTYKWELSTKKKKVVSVWKEEKKIGAGGFGSVWLQRENGGQLRAVKRLSRDTLPETGFSQELLALVKLKDASLPRVFTCLY